MVFGVHTKPESCKRVYLITRLHGLSFQVESNYEPYLLGGLPQVTAVNHRQKDTTLLFLTFHDKEYLRRRG
jgi:hypothetical protein